MMGNRDGNRRRRVYHRGEAADISREMGRFYNWLTWFEGRRVNPRGLWRSMPLVDNVDTFPRMSMERGLYYLLMATDGWSIADIYNLHTWVHFPFAGLSWEWRVAQWIAVRGQWEPGQYAEALYFSLWALEFDAANPTIWGNTQPPSEDEANSVPSVVAEDDDEFTPSI